MGKSVTLGSSVLPVDPTLFDQSPAIKDVAKGEVQITLGPSTGTKKGKRIKNARPPVGLVAGAIAGADAGFNPRIGAPLFTASSVGAELSGGALSRMLPPTVRAALLEALGHRGVLSSVSALAILGPIGRHLHNPSFWMNAFGAHREVSQALSAIGGPGNGKIGVLGEWGPASERAYQQLRDMYGDFAKEFLPGGRLAVLGPWGPLGALAGLGFLGATGGHGFVLDKNGNFVDGQGRIERTTDVKYQGRAKSYPLFEAYTEDRAARMRNNDASWMVRGQLDHKDKDGDSFTFTAPANKPITLTAVPERAGERYAVELLDAKGRSVARSDSESLVNWIHVGFDKPTKLTARITRLPDDKGVDPFVMAINAMLFPLVATGQMFAPYLEAAGFAVDPIGPDRYRLYTVSA